MDSLLSQVTTSVNLEKIIEVTAKESYISLKADTGNKSLSVDSLLIELASIDLHIHLWRVAVCP